jgi:hypothetical protein
MYRNTTYRSATYQGETTMATKTAKKKTTKPKTAAGDNKKQTAEKKLIAGAFAEHSVCGRILTALHDGEPHTFAEILKAAKPKSEKQTREFTMGFLARHGEKSGLYQLTIEGDRPNDVSVHDWCKQTERGVNDSARRSVRPLQRA